MVVSFSGNRGYHVAVYDERLLGLGREERQEIVEYLTGANMDPSLHGLTASLGPRDGPDYTEHGWRGRIARQSYTILSSLARGDERTVKMVESRLGLRSVESLKTLEPLWRERPRWDLLGGRGETRAKAITALVELALEGEKTNIDTVVTTDIHRLLRMAETLNGKTGLKAATIPIESVEEYDPLREAVALPENPDTKIRVAYAPRFRLAEEHYGPYSDEEVRLPTYAASYLICRGVAKLVERGIE
jgi:DNA primase small subunit